MSGDSQKHTTMLVWTTRSRQVVINGETLGLCPLIHPGATWWVLEGNDKGEGRSNDNDKGEQLLAILPGAAVD